MISALGTGSYSLTPPKVNRARAAVDAAMKDFTNRFGNVDNAIHNAQDKVDGAKSKFDIEQPEESLGLTVARYRQSASRQRGKLQE